ncbi:uncharacterized protein KIAA1143 homolog [Daphnia pulex]|uniref:uncharacterized protein KIAA1143 homolog n=1 Tax=Daphnia pulex TaxID=6669 RepID=UPI001EDD3185|nr:uncharacterized protein KIAA1143 homolog [Daphnia pulex]
MGPKRNQVSYIKPNEPAFLRRIKQQAGYKEGPDVDTKREQYQGDSDNDEYAEEKEDEKPIVVVLRSGDLTAEEATKEEVELKEKEERELIEKGKIVFKPQKKRTQISDEPNGSEIANVKKVKKEDSGSSTKSESSKDTAKKSSLLSFNDEDE